MMDDKSWGPWLEHDGKKCPVPVGTFVLVDIPAVGILEGVAGCSSTCGGPCKMHGGQDDPLLSHWIGRPFDNPLVVTRYRVRPPHALKEMIKLAEAPTIALQPIKEGAA